MIVHDHLWELAKRRNPVYFIQIGANDGDQNDPLRHFIKKYRWSGILVEPVPEYFATLRINYQGLTGVYFENVAISDSESSQVFWYLEDSEGKLPDWARGLGSFFKDNVTAEISGTDLESHLRSVEVRCFSLNDLLQKYDHPAVDLVLIDTQGYDGKIIMQIDFTLMKPSVIVFEHNLLDEIEKQECRAKLEAQGYSFKEDRWDIVAYLEK